MSERFTRRISLIVSIFALLAAGGSAIAADLPPALVPWPKTVQLTDSRMTIPGNGRIVAADPKLLPLATILSDDVYRASGVRLSSDPTIEEAGKPGDIVLQFDPKLKGEAYHIAIGATAVVSAGTYRGVAWGTMTVLQALNIDNGKLSLPRGQITDDSDIKFRSAEHDIARKWFPLANLYELVDLFAYYKVNHLMLHMNDHGMFTFGSELYPELPTTTDKGVKHYYTLAELKALVAYADARGVTIIPEIEMPSHTDAASLSPKVFGTKDPATGEYKRFGYINITRDDTVEACGKLLDEVMDVFASSDYVSIGADEVGNKSFENASEYAEFHKKYPDDQPIEHLIAAMDTVVKKRGKTLMCYARGGPSDVVQMPWTGNDNASAAKGYMVLAHNTGSVTHHVPTMMEPPYNTILLYSGFETAYNFDFEKDKKVAPANLKQMLGVQTLTWQHWHYMAFFDLRRTMASLSENAWNYSRRADFKPFDQWRDTMWDRTNARLGDMVFPVKVQESGLLCPGKDIVFYKTMTVKLSCPLKGTIRYRQEPLDYWNPPALPTADSPVYKDPITITGPTVIYARLFDDTGKPIGFGTERHYFPIDPKVECAAYWDGDLTKAMSATDPAIDMPTVYAWLRNDDRSKGLKLSLPEDDASLAKLNVKPTYTFPLGRLTLHPSYEGVYQRGWYYVMKGQIKIDTAGEYAFHAYGSQTALTIDGKTAATIVGDKSKSEKLELTAGLHAFEVIAQGGNNSAKVAEFEGPQGGALRPLDELMVLLPQYAAGSSAASSAAAVK